MITLRPYQNEGVNAIRQSFAKGNRAPLYVLPTGGGKTVVFSHLSKVVSERKKRVLIIVHRVELLRQTSRALTQFGVAHGLINPKFSPRYYERVQIGSIQTIVHRLEKISKPDLIIIDECHHATASTWSKVLNYFATRQLGVTATPIRSDGQGLGVNVGGQFDDMIVGPQIRELISMGFLVKPKIYAPLQKLDLSGVKIVRGDYDKKEVEIAMDSADIIGNSVDHYKQICPGMPAVAFCISVKHAEYVAKEFRKAGYNAEFVHGDMDDEDRVKVLNGLGNGTIHVVASCDLISEGTDIPAIFCAILLRPTQSTGLYIQQVGRALRILEGKNGAIILDHVGNVITHGIPEEHREWSLDGEKKKRRRKGDGGLVRALQCPSCFAVHEPLPACPYCGHVHQKKEEEMPTETDGVLEEVTAEAAEEISRKRKMQQHKEVTNAKSLAELEDIARQRGYKPGWAKYVFKSKQAKLQQMAERHGK